MAGGGAGAWSDLWLSSASQTDDGGGARLVEWPSVHPSIGRDLPKAGCDRLLVSRQLGPSQRVARIPLGLLPCQSGPGRAPSGDGLV